jgi:hypothetical protein
VTLVASHSEKEGAAGTFKGGYGFDPFMAYCDETSEALAAILRPGNAGSNTAADQIAVVEQALAQIPAEYIEDIEILVRADTAGATHDLLDFCREHRLRYTVGYELTDQVRAAILTIPEDAWICARAADGSERANGQVAEITEHLDLTAWPTASRVIVRRERAHPGAQLTFTDHDGHRFGGALGSPDRFRQGGPQRRLPPASKPRRQTRQRRMTSPRLDPTPTTCVAAARAASRRPMTRSSSAGSPPTRAFSRRMKRSPSSMSMSLSRSSTGTATRGHTHASAGWRARFPIFFLHPS